MKILLAVVLSLLCLTVHCKPANVKNTDNGLRRSYRSDQAMVIGYTGDRVEEEPQVNAEEGTVQETGTDTPTEIEQTAQDNVPDTSNVDDAVTQKEPEAPVKETRQLDSDEDESDEDDESNPWDISRSGLNNAFFNFFPVSFGGNRGRSGGFPDGTVAVANSFSTGRRGVASSSANAFNDPSALFRNANKNVNSQ